MDRLYRESWSRSRCCFSNPLPARESCSFGNAERSRRAADWAHDVAGPQRIRSQAQDAASTHECGIIDAADTDGGLNEQVGPRETERVGRVSAGPCPVEDALAKALSAASAAGQWEVVGQLAAELQARREAREAKAAAESAKVIQLGRGRRNGGAS
jgi:hypothetical protein